MTIARPRFLLAVALGLIVGGLSTALALAEDKSEHNSEKEISEVLATLPAADRKLAVAQRFCPIMQYSRLGADGVPQKIMVDGTSIFVCCEGCIDAAKEGGKKTLATVKKLIKASANLAKLPAKERAEAEAQKYCVIANKNLLGLMGAPIRLELDGKPVYVCCKGCVKKAKADPAAALAKAEALREAGEGHDHDDH